MSPRPCRALVAAATLVLIALLNLIDGPAHGQDTSLSDATRRIKELRDANRYPDAAAAGQQAIERAEATIASQPNAGIMLLQEHAFTLMMLARYAEAEPVHRRALDIARSVDPRHPLAYVSMVPLAQIAERLGRMADAEVRFKANVAYLEGVFGAGSADLDMSIEELAEFYERHARLGEAERERHRALLLVEGALGSGHIKTAAKLRGLARLIMLQGRPDEAEPLVRRAVGVGEAAFGPEYPLLAGARADLANVLLALGRPDEALPFARLAVDGMKRVFGIEHSQTAEILRVLGRIAYELDRLDESEASYRDALVYFETHDASRHIGVARALAGLADIQERRRGIAEAETLRRRVLEITEAALGKEHPETAAAHRALGSLYFDKKNWVGARDHYRAANEALIKSETLAIGQSEANARRETSAGTAGQSDSHMAIVRSLARIVEPGTSTAGSIEEAFVSAQRVALSSAARAVAQMASRQAVDDPVLARLVRERQDLVVEWRSRDRLLIDAVARSDDARDRSNETGLRQRLGSIEARIGEIDRDVRSRFPSYAALAIPEPATIAEVQRLLAEDEAMVVFLDTPKWGDVAEEAFVWVVTKHEASWAWSNLGTAALAQEVAALRCGLDQRGWLEGACQGLLDATMSDEDIARGKPLPFDHARAHRLYNSLLGSVAAEIKGKKLLVVASGALAQLPLQVLVTEPPRSGDHRAVRWLARDHAVTVLPAVSALQSLRRTVAVNRERLPLIGFGNPLLDGDQEDLKDGPVHRRLAALARLTTDCGKVGSITDTTRTPVRSQRSARTAPLRGLADGAELAAQVPLPDTADELCAVSHELGGDPGEVRLGARATEREVKALGASGHLGMFGIVHFATHGVLAGQVSGMSEPGLILTPPMTPSETDDGYLSASEIASLKLDADWVIMSACNTAGGDAGGEVLSGVARAFFYAGARSVLASHWEVNSAATVKLVTSAVQAIATDRRVGRSQALRQAMLAMIDGGRPREAHPSYWAPFVLVGESAR